jgi:hypothetical protein
MVDLEAERLIFKLVLEELGFLVKVTVAVEPQTLIPAVVAVVHLPEVMVGQVAWVAQVFLFQLQDRLQIMLVVEGDGNVLLLLLRLGEWVEAETAG